MRHFQIPLLSTFAFALLLLAGCGGGGGGGGDDFDLRDGPAIQSITPVPEAADVDVDTSVEFVFEEALDPASVGPAQVRVRQGSDPVPGTVSYVAARRAIVFLPTDGVLPANATFRVELQPGIRDLEDNVREEALAFEFDTRLPVAGAPFLLTTEPDRNVLPTEVLMNDLGVGMVVYRLQDHESPSDPRYARIWRAGEGFEAAHLLQDADEPSSRTYGGSDVGDRTFITSWHTRFYSDQNDAQLQTYDVASRTWSGEISLETVPSVEAAAPVVARSTAGYRIAVWEQEFVSNGRTDIVTRIYRPGDGWGIRTGIDGSIDPAAGPHADMNESGQVVVAFDREVGDEDHVYARLWDPTDGWSDLEPMGSEDADYASAQEVRIAEDGSAIVIWKEAHSGNDRVFARRFNPAAPGGPAWEAARELTPAVGDSRAIHAYMDAAGNATILQNFDGPDGHFLSHVRYQVGTGWGTPVPLTLPNYSAVQRIRVDVDRRGIAVVWRGRDTEADTSFEILAAVTDESGRFGAPLRIAPLLGNAPGESYYDVARTPGNGVAVVWRDVNEVDNDEISTVHYRAVDAAGFGAPVQDLDVTGLREHNGMRLDIDTMGRGFLVYSRARIDESREQLWAAEIR